MTQTYRRKRIRDAALTKTVNRDARDAKQSRFSRVIHAPRQIAL